MPPRASSSRKRAASPLPDPIVDLKAQKAALQERYDALKSQYEANLAHSKKTDQRLERIEAALMARGEGAAVAAPALASVNDGEVRRLKEQNEALLKSLAASNEAAELARVAARKAEENLAAARAAGQPELDEEAAAAEALFRAKERNSDAEKDGKRIEVCIKNSDGQRMFFKTSLRTTVGKHVDPNMVRLYFGGNRLSFSDTVKKVGLEEGDVIDFIVDQVGC